MQGRLAQYDLLKPLYAHPAHLNFSRSQLYLAQTPQTQSLLVVKLLPMMADKLEQELFFNEIKVLQQLDASDSLHYLPLYASGQDTLVFESSGLKPQWVNYLVLPYLKQGSIRQFLDNQSYTLQQAGQLWLGMLDAVSVLHQQGWLHLDLKPSNFLLKNSDEVCLIDFAMAQRINAKPPTSVAITQGTPRYMSPEQFLGQPLTMQTDFYSLGLILYEMLTGQSMFNATSYQAWAVQHCQHPVPVLSQKLTSFQPLIDGLLAKNRHNRLNEVIEIRQMAQQAFDDAYHLL